MLTTFICPTLMYDKNVENLAQEYQFCRGATNSSSGAFKKSVIEPVY
jgi:hypothetical protein